MSCDFLRKLWNSWIPLAACGLLLALTAGCSTPVTKTGAVVYSHGSLVANESINMDDAWDACHGALKRLEFEEESGAKDALEATLVAKSATDRRITFNLRRITDKTTEVRIRVGMFGDERMAREIHEAFRKSF
jgi:hypothetical protein